MLNDALAGDPQELISALRPSGTENERFEDPSHTTQYTLSHPAFGEVGLLTVQAQDQPVKLRCTVEVEVEPIKVSAGSELLSATINQRISELLTRCNVPKFVVRVKISCLHFSALRSMTLKVTHKELMVRLDCDGRYDKLDLYVRGRSLEDQLCCQRPVLKCDASSFPTPRLLSWVKVFYMSAPEHIMVAKSLIRRRKKHCNLNTPIFVHDLSELGGQLVIFSEVHQVLNDGFRSSAKVLTNEELHAYFAHDLHHSEGQSLNHYYGEGWEHQQALGYIAQLIDPRALYQFVENATPSLPVYATIARLISLKFFGFADGSPRSNQFAQDRSRAMLDLICLVFGRALLYRDEVCLGLRGLIAMRLFQGSARLSFKSYLSIYMTRTLRKCDDEVRSEARRTLQAHRDDELSPLDQLVRRVSSEYASRHELNQLLHPSEPQSLEASLQGLGSLSALIGTLGLLIIEGEQPLRLGELSHTRPRPRSRSGMSLREALNARARPNFEERYDLESLKITGTRGEEKRYRPRLIMWLSGLLEHAGYTELLRGLCSTTHALFYLKWERLTLEFACITTLAHRAYPEADRALSSATSLPLLSPLAEAQDRLVRVKLRHKAWRDRLGVGLAACDPLMVPQRQLESVFDRCLRLDELINDLESDVPMFRETLTWFLISQLKSPANEDQQRM